MYGSRSVHMLEDSEKGGMDRSCQMQEANMVDKKSKPIVLILQ